MDDAGSSCSTPEAESPTMPWKLSLNCLKLEIYNEFLEHFKDVEEIKVPGFEDDLWAHFDRFPHRYVLNVYDESPEVVLTHMKVLQMAADASSGHAVDVRAVQVLPPLHSGSSADSLKTSMQGEECSSSMHTSPVSGSSPNLSLGLEIKKTPAQDGDSVANTNTLPSRPVHEITFSTTDTLKLLSQLTWLVEIGLNIQEAHVFNTYDGCSLNVFVVEGWPYEETEQLRHELQRKIQKNFEKQALSKPSPKTALGDIFQVDHIEIPTDETDVWEIDVRLLKFETEVESGTDFTMYKGTYCSQDVAIKVLQNTSRNMQQEFGNEVSVLRKVRHKNIVQFIGACTRPPRFCIVTEFMSRGSVRDILKQTGAFELPALLRVAIDVSKGMNYLHQNNIIHRDIKSVNLLMDDNGVVKIADFGVARVKCPTGVMTPETGSYRWMAPEVIAHRNYDHKVDVYSFGMFLYELLTGELPYGQSFITGDCLDIIKEGLRPPIPENADCRLASLIKSCWEDLRPEFSDILENLQRIADEVKSEERHKGKSSSGFASSLKWRVKKEGTAD